MPSSDSYLGIRIIGQNTYLTSLTVIPDNSYIPPGSITPSSSTAYSSSSSSSAVIPSSSSSSSFYSSSSSSIDPNSVVDGGIFVVDGGVRVIDS